MTEPRGTGAAGGIGGEQTLASDAEVALSVRGLVKQYPGVQALSGVDLTVRKGEVRALLGKNGAGKSTLVKILSGVVQPDAGEVWVGGRQVELDSPSSAGDMGIQTVYQELGLVPEMTVAENIMLGRWREAGGRFGVTNQHEIRRRAKRALDQLEVALDPGERVSRLSVAHQQVVEIAKALSFTPSVLIMDEPTSSLPAHEVDVLIKLIRRLAATGIAIIYVSHRMMEIPLVADSVTVLRDGVLIDTLPVAKAPTAHIVELMTGGIERRGHVAARDRSAQQNVLSVRGLSAAPKVQDVSFDLREGEILGLAGLLGSGRSEVLRCIFGLDKADEGEIEIGGRTVDHRTPRAMAALGVGMTPEDRKREGLALDLSVTDNLIMSSFRRVRRGLAISRARERGLAQSMVRELAIKTPSTGTRCRVLSGGNQQKVVLGRWLNAEARVLLMDEPTRGIDIHAKEQFYGLIRKLAEGGMSVVVVSSELEELFLMCDRLVVLNHGRSIADLPVGDASLDQVMTMTMEGA